MILLAALSSDSLIFKGTFKIHPRYSKSFSLKVPADKVLVLRVSGASPNDYSVVLFDEKGFTYFQKNKDSSWSMHTLEGDSTFTCYLNRKGTLNFVIWNNSYEEKWISPSVKVYLRDGRDSTDCFLEYGE